MIRPFTGMNAMRTFTCSAIGLVFLLSPAQAQTFQDAVRGNLALGLELCIRSLPSVDATRNALAAAGFTYAREDFGGGEVLHWYSGPAETVSIAVSEGQMAPDCRVTTSHLGVTETVALIGAVLQQRFPGVFTYGNMENTPPVTAKNLGNRWEFCTGYVGWAGQRPITLAIGNAGQDPACVEDGTSQTVVTP